MRRKLSEVKRFIRSRYMVRFSRYEVAEFLAAERGDPEAEDCAEDSGDSWVLMAEALDQASRGLYVGVPGLGEGEDAEDVDGGRHRWVS